jgi:hypothetical protein
MHSSPMRTPRMGQNSLKWSGIVAVPALDFVPGLDFIEPYGFEAALIIGP